MKQNKLTVIGKTPDGEVFRPSDWNYRLACLAGSFKNNKLQYNKYVTPVWVYSEGVPGLLVDKELEEMDPVLYTFIRDFVLDNDLRVKFTDGENDEKSERDVGDVESASRTVYDI